LILPPYVPLAYSKAIPDEQDSVLFCLATDLGSKATGEWEKEPFVQGWAAMPGEYVHPLLSNADWLIRTV
jgi:hypothetical protein